MAKDELNPTGWQPSAQATIHAVFQCGACGHVQPVFGWIRKGEKKPVCKVCKKDGRTKKIANAMTQAQFDAVFKHEPQSQRH